jgi:predicted Zn-dependent protease
MPYWAERVGTPRTLAVEFPFGHTLGLPGDVDLQRQTLTKALDALLIIQAPGDVVYSEQQWPGSVEEAIHSWQPTEPSPIITELTPKFRDMLRKRRKT